MTGKVASKAAKKVAKELISDSAVRMAEDIIFHYQMEQWLSGKYDTEPGYEAVCLDGKEECKKPAQVKKQLSSLEKEQLEKKVEQNLEKRAGTHKGWGKWLDWIVPIFLTGTAVSWLDTTLDPDTEDLFDQVAKESLEDLGFIKPIKKKNLVVNPDGNPFILPEDDSPIDYGGTEPVKIPDFNITKEINFTNTGITSSEYELEHEPYLQSILYQTIQRDIATVNPLFITESISFKFYNDNFMIFRFYLNNERLVLYPNFNVSPSDYLKHVVMLSKKNEDDFTKLSTSTSNRIDVIHDGEINLTDIKKIEFYPVIQSNNFRPDRFKRSDLDYYLRIIKIHTSSDIFTLTLSLYMHSDDYSRYATYQNKVVVKEEHLSLDETTLGHQISIFNNAQIIPDYEPNLEDILLNSINSSKYKDDNGNIKVIPPTVIPIKTPDGTIIKPDGDGGWIDVNTNEPVVVTDEEELIVEDPEITPDGIVIPGTNETIDPIPEPDPNPNPNPNPDPSGNETKPNLPWEIIIALLDMLRSILQFMVRLFAYILTLPAITAIPIENPTFQWFRSAEWLGIEVYNVVSGLATFALALVIYRIVRRVF